MTASSYEDFPFLLSLVVFLLFNLFIVGGGPESEMQSLLRARGMSAEAASNMDITTSTYKDCQFRSYRKSFIVILLMEASDAKSGIFV